MQRYFGEVLKENVIFLSKEDQHHLLNVMRGRVGEMIEVIIATEVYLCRIACLSPLELAICEKLSINRELPINLTLYYCMPKGDKFEFILQKATELGVSEIYAVNSSRSIVKIDKKDYAKKAERYQRIINEASCQAHRNIRPAFKGFINLGEINPDSYDYAFIAYEEEALKKQPFFHSYQKIAEQESVAILVGPEGGFSAQEVELMVNRGFETVSLGKRILRSETAVLYILSVIGFIIEGK